LVPRGREVGLYIVADGRAQWQAVKLGLVGRDAAEILEGLTEATLVVREPLRGKATLEEGQRVKARNAVEAP
jgi:hypothetical protein